MLIRQVGFIRTVSWSARNTESHWSHEHSDGFTHRPKRPWSRALRFWGPRTTLSYDDSTL